MRTVQRVSEEYIKDPDSGLYYWLAPIYKRGTEQELLDDMSMQVEQLANMKQEGEHVFRPTAMIQKKVINSMALQTLERLSQNTYLMLFDYGAAEPDSIPDGGRNEWVSEGNNIFYVALCILHSNFTVETVLGI